MEGFEDMEGFENMEGFEENCPYFRPTSPDRPSQYSPMFRFKEQFGEYVPVFSFGLSEFADYGISLSVYTGDSYGDHCYIDTSITRACSMQCGCQSLESDSLASNSFAFEVRKTSSGIVVMLHSWTLQVYVPFFLAQGKNPPSENPHIIGGFHLLRNIDLLETRLRELRAKMQGSTPAAGIFGVLILSSKDLARLEAELSLLVEGLVADDQVFESFGYENLYEEAYLTYDRWKFFQNSKTSRSLDQLDWATHNIDQLEGDEDFNEIGSDDPAEVFQTPHSMPPVPSLGITCPQYEVGAPVSHQTLPLIAAIYLGRNDVIAELLASRANPMILSQIKEEDQWLVAQSLLDHGVNATSLFESTHGF